MLGRNGTCDPPEYDPGPINSKHAGQEREISGFSVPRSAAGPSSFGDSYPWGLGLGNTSPCRMLPLVERERSYPDLDASDSR